MARLDAFTILGILFQPALVAFVWEPLVIFLFFFGRFLSKFGKTLAIPMKEVKPGFWFAQEPHWVKPTKDRGNWSRGKDETHRLETELTAFIQTGLNSYPVQFFNVRKQRPMHVAFQEIEHKGKKNSFNPSSEAWTRFAKDEAYRQQMAANKTGRPDILTIILLGCTFLLVGFVIAYFALPPHYITIPAGSTVGGNGAITQTITTSTERGVNGSILR